jgi:hypothetical protein
LSFHVTSFIDKSIKPIFSIVVSHRVSSPGNGGRGGLEQGSCIFLALGNRDLAKKPTSLSSRGIKNVTGGTVMEKGKRNC